MKGKLILRSGLISRRKTANNSAHLKELLRRIKKLNPARLPSLAEQLILLNPRIWRGLPLVTKAAEQRQPALTAKQTFGVSEGTCRPPLASFGLPSDHPFCYSTASSRARRSCACAAGNGASAAPGLVPGFRSRSRREEGRRRVLGRARRANEGGQSNELPERYRGRAPGPLPLVDAQARAPGAVGGASPPPSPSSLLRRCAPAPSLLPP